MMTAPSGTTTATTTNETDSTNGGINLSGLAGGGGGGCNDGTTTLENDIEQWVKKRMYALRELVSSEESYVQDLSYIVDGYIHEINDPHSDILMPDDLKDGKHRLVFGNVEAIYDWHRE